MHLLYKNNNEFMIVPKGFGEITKMKGWELIREIKIKKEIDLDKSTKVIVTSDDNKYILVKSVPNETFFFDSLEELKGALKVLKKDSFINSL